MGAAHRQIRPGYFMLLLIRFHVNSQLFFFFFFFGMKRCKIDLQPQTKAPILFELTFFFLGGFGSGDFFYTTRLSHVLGFFTFVFSFDRKPTLLRFTRA